MFPGIVFCVMSRDIDFVADVASLLRHRGAEVYIATSWDEYTRLQSEIVFDGLVVDPVYCMTKGRAIH